MAVLLLYTCTAVVRSINTVTPHGDNPSVSLIDTHARARARTHAHNDASELKVNI